MLVLKTFIFVFGSLIISLLLVANWIVEHFGYINFEQIYISITLPAENAIGLFEDSIRKYLKITLAMIIVWFLVVFGFRIILAGLLFIFFALKYLFIKFFKILVCSYESLPNVSKTADKLYTSVVFLLLVVGILAALNTYDKRFKLYAFIENLYFVDNKNDFFKDNYKLPQNITFPNGKKNIVIVALESYEHTFYEANKDYTPFSYELIKNNNGNVNMFQAYGTAPTIMALSSWFFGVPQKTFISKKNFNTLFDNSFPNVISIFDILKNNGYELSLINGTEAHFTNKDLLFKTHGFTKIKDMIYFINNGYLVDENRGVWGFGDNFVFDRAIEEFIQNKNSHNPFVMLIENVDTHESQKYPFEQKYGDVRDAWLHTDKALEKFINNLKVIGLDNTAVVIVGDHMLAKLPFEWREKRSIYNVFLGDVPKIPEHKKYELFSAIDMAPTFLHLAGAAWENNQFGIGISLFSDNKTIGEIMGIENFNTAISKYSNFYIDLMK